MSYSGRPAFRWDRIAGFTVWLGAASVLFPVMVANIVEGCFWEEGCESSQIFRFVISLVVALAIATPFGLAIGAVIRRLIRFDA